VLYLVVSELAVVVIAPALNPPAVVSAKVCAHQQRGFSPAGQTRHNRRCQSAGVEIRGGGVLRSAVVVPAPSTLPRRRGERATVQRSGSNGVTPLASPSHLPVSTKRGGAVPEFALVAVAPALHPPAAVSAQLMRATHGDSRHPAG